MTIRQNMLGARIDYLLLHPFTHKRQMAAESDLRRIVETELTLSPVEARARLQKLMDRFEGRFPLDERLSYLDVGSGLGEIALALALAGCRDVTGIDLVGRNVAAASRNAQAWQVADRVQFIHQNILDWTPPRRYDVLISNEALEHIADPRAFLGRLRDFVAPDGIALLAFGPLFHSPFGDHMDDFFRLPIPWRGVLFSEQAILKLRAECYRPTEPVQSYRQITGGLNQMRFSEFLEHVAASGWQSEYLNVNPQLKRIPLLHRLSNRLTRTPLVRDYFAGSIYTALRQG